MKKIRIVQHRGKYLLMWGRELLSGLWKTHEEVVAAKQEWIV